MKIVRRLSKREKVKTMKECGVDRSKLTKHEKINLIRSLRKGDEVRILLDDWACQVVCIGQTFRSTKKKKRRYVKIMPYGFYSL